jgi:LysR family hydrogen peroxide-inducible transcriptional activator
MPTLRQLRYLTALATHGHFGRAADACAVSQPAMSQQIADLEAELGARLIERGPRGAKLTETGVEIAARARGILSAVGDLSKAARGGEDLTGPLRLGVIPTIAPYLLPKALPAMRALYPAVEFRVREAVSATLLTELTNGGLDLLLMALPAEGEGVETLPLFEDGFVLVTAADDAPKGPVDPATLAPETLLLLDDGHCLRDQALSVCGLADAALRAQLGATSLATLVQLAAAGLGRTFVPEMALETLVSHDPRVRATAFKKPIPSRTIGLAYRSTASSKTAFARLGEAIKRAR